MTHHSITLTRLLVLIALSSRAGWVQADPSPRAADLSPTEQTASGGAFLHPGGLLTEKDFARMRAKVAAGEHPWIDSWNALIVHPKARSTWKPSPTADMDESRQRASADAVAAYLNILRWRVSGDTAFADCAVRICNGWSAKVNVSSGDGLVGIPIYEFAIVGELLRDYPGWAPGDFARFKTMMEQYLYRSCHNFLVHHEGTPVSHCWANWDLCNMTGILAIGVLCDDRAKYEEAVEYFKNGAGNGSIEHAVPFVYPGGLGQWQETGRDQEHTQLGVGMMAAFCQIAWNQGLDLYGYDHNRFLAAAEYVAAYNLWKPVPYKFYNNADNVNNYWPSEETWGGRGRLQRPIWELIYNHYVVLKGLKAPNLKAMAEVYRPEGFEHDDNFGFGTLTFTLDAAASPYPPSPAPAIPKALTATAGVDRVCLRWTPSETANGYIVQRATSSGGPYETIATYFGAFPVYDDNHVTDGTSYFYVVAAKNQAGTSGNSLEVKATPMNSGNLPSNWKQADIGACSHPGDASYANVSNRTFVVSGTGEGIGAKADGLCFVYTKVTGACTITARRALVKFDGGEWQKTGVMIRESLEPGAKTLMMASGDVGAREAKFGTRASDAQGITWQNGDAYTSPGPPTWFRMRRSGDTFTACQSIDGTTWFTVGTPKIVHMKAVCYIGFAVGSNGDKTDSATFDNVELKNDGRQP
jgi:hypothetical protein